MWRSLFSENTVFRAAIIATSPSNVTLSTDPTMHSPHRLKESVRGRKLRRTPLTEMIIDKLTRKCELSQSRDQFIVPRCAAIADAASASRVAHVASASRIARHVASRVSHPARRAAAAGQSIDLVAAALQARRHGAIVVIPDSIDVAARLHAAAGFGGIESGLALGPTVALELIRRLLILRLPILGVNDQIVGRSLRTIGRSRRLIRIVGRIDHRITVFIGSPRVIDIVGVVVRAAADPHHRVIGRQHRNDQPRRRSHDDEAGAARRIPDAAVEIIAIASSIIRPIFPRQRRAHGAHGGIVASVVIALIEHLTTPIECRPAFAAIWPNDSAGTVAAAGTPLGTLAAARSPLRALGARALTLLGGYRPGSELHTHQQHRQRQQGDLGACLSIPREPRWQGEGADARRAAQSIVDTMDKPCNAAYAPAHRAAGTAKYNGCARAKCLANPSGPGRFPLMRRCRLLIGCIPNCVGSALPEGKSAAVAATWNTQTGSLVR